MGGDRVDRIDCTGRIGMWYYYCIPPYRDSLPASWVGMLVGGSAGAMQVMEKAVRDHFFLLQKKDFPPRVTLVVQAALPHLAIGGWWSSSHLLLLLLV